VPTYNIHKQQSDYDFIVALNKIAKSTKMESENTNQNPVRQK